MKRSAASRGQLLSSVLLLLHVSGSAAKFVSGHITSYEEWIFVDKFCFGALGNNSGSVFLDFSGHDSATNVTVLLYDDQKVEWAEVFESGESCSERVEHAHTKLTSPSVIRQQVMITESSRPRWWYVVVATCGSRSQLILDYKLQFNNRGGLLATEFSWNDQGLLQTYALCTVLQTILAVTYSCNLSAARTATRRLHAAPSVVFMMLCALSSSLLLSTAHYTVYAFNGVGLPWARVAAWVGRMLFQLGTIVFGVALAKGWTISNEGLKTDPRFSMLVGTLICLHLLAFCWHWYVQDPAAVEYVFDTPPGLIVVGLRVLALVWFWCELMRNIKYYSEGSEGRRFYLMFGSVFGVWMVSFPVIIVIAYFLQPWLLQRVTSTLVTCTDTIASALLAWCAWPIWIALNMDASGHVRGKNEVGSLMMGTYSSETSQLMGVPPSP